MALIKCPECTREISDRAESCPQCGLPIATKTETCKEKQKSRVTLVSEGCEWILFRCPACEKVDKINLAKTIQTNTGYDLTGEGCCTCGRVFNEVYRGISSQESVGGGSEKIIKKGEFVGIGALVQIFGLILLFIFPLGTVAGILLLLIGSRMAIKLKCGGCGNSINNKEVKLCPNCRAQFV